MGEIAGFVPKSELERVRLIREARAIYDSIFPPTDAVGERLDAGKGDAIRLKGLAPSKGNVRMTARSQPLDRHIFPVHCRVIVNARLPLRAFSPWRR
jgi:hypothetical protein